MKRSTARLCVIAVLGIGGLLTVDRVSIADCWGCGGYGPGYYNSGYGYASYYGLYSAGYSPWYSAYYAPVSWGGWYSGCCSSGCGWSGCGSCGGCLSGGCGLGCSSCSGGCGWGGGCGGCGGCGYSLCDLGCCGGCGSGCSTCAGGGCAPGTPGAGCGTTTAPPAGAQPPEGFQPRPSPPYDQAPQNPRPRAKEPAAGEPGAGIGGALDSGAPTGTQYKRGQTSDGGGAGDARTFEEPATGAPKSSGTKPAPKSNGNDQTSFEAKKPLETIPQKKAPLPRMDDESTPSAGQPSKTAPSGERTGSVPPAALGDDNHSFAMIDGDRRLNRANPALKLQERPTWHYAASRQPTRFEKTAVVSAPERLSPSAPNWAVLPADAAVARD